LKQAYLQQIKAVELVAKNVLTAAKKWMIETEAIRWKHAAAEKEIIDQTQEWVMHINHIYNMVDETLKPSSHTPPMEAGPMWRIGAVLMSV
jgi:hypothetical protein